MAGGLFALLDDVAALARLGAASTDDVAAAAGKASAQAVGVVVDDTAVTPRYVQGLAAERELPIIKKIAIGSLRNKIVFILPVIMVFSQFLPTAVTIILILGGLYLSYEGAEKIVHALKHRSQHGFHTAAEQETEDEATESVGVAAMLWVGGHILRTNVAELGWHAPYDAVRHAEHTVSHAVGALGGVLGWLANTFASAIVGIVVGCLLVPVMELVMKGRRGEAESAH